MSSEQAPQGNGRELGQRREKHLPRPSERLCDRLLLQSFYFAPEIDKKEFDAKRKKN